jgi:hypothetical protein
MLACRLGIPISLDVAFCCMSLRTSPCWVFDLDYVRSNTLSILKSSTMPTSVVGPYRVIHRIPKITQYLRAVWLLDIRGAHHHLVSHDLLQQALLSYQVL